jgi:hypothetical protein
MATAKKTSATSTKKSAAKKPAIKRAPAKARSTTTVRKAAAPKDAPVKSFRPHHTSREAFFTFRITHQTVYWLILAGVVLVLGIWVTDISIKVQHIYDQIDASNIESLNIPDHLR